MTGFAPVTIKARLVRTLNSEDTQKDILKQYAEVVDHLLILYATDAAKNVDAARTFSKSTELDTTFRSGLQQTGRTNRLRRNHRSERPLQQTKSVGQQPKDSTTNFSKTCWTFLESVRRNPKHYRKSNSSWPLAIGWLQWEEQKSSYHGSTKFVYSIEEWGNFRVHDCVTQYDKPNRIYLILWWFQDRLSFHEPRALLLCLWQFNAHFLKAPPYRWPREVCGVAE